MKGKACSWRDMRRIKHIFDNQERLKGELAALSNCVDPNTMRGWKKILDVMECLNGDLKIAHCQPTHCRTIATLAPKDAWPQWVETCEREKYTVPQLRSVLLAAKSAATIVRAQSSLPSGKYSTLVIDPPWSYSNKSGRHGSSANADYTQGRTMSFDEVLLFDVSQWAATECHLYLWVTDAYVGHAYAVTESWGFDAKATLVWVKDRIGMGNYFRHQHELCIFAVKGSMRLKRMDISTVFHAPMTKHSEKPDEFYRIVESCSPGPYLDVFARKHRQGWDVFGDEVPSLALAAVSS